MIRKEDDGRITFSIDSASVKCKAIYIVGDFNDWNTRATKLMKKEDRWMKTLKLKPGVYQYKFVTEDDEWINDPKADYYASNPFGGENSVVVVS